MNLLTWCLPCKLNNVWGSPEIEEEITEKFDPSENSQKASTLLSQVMKHQLLVLLYLLNQFCTFFCWASPPSPAIQLRTSAFGVSDRYMETFSPVWLGSGWFTVCCFGLGSASEKIQNLTKSFGLHILLFFVCFERVGKLSVCFVAFFLMVSVISLAFI